MTTPPLVNGNLELDLASREEPLRRETVASGSLMLLDAGKILCPNQAASAGIWNAVSDASFSELCASGRLIWLGRVRTSESSASLQRDETQGSSWYGLDLTGLTAPECIKLFGASTQIPRAQLGNLALDADPAPRGIPDPGENRWLSPRNLESESEATCAQLAVTLMTVARWHRDSHFCGRCARPTRVLNSGWVRECECGLVTYPRTDPVMIVAVLDADNRLLLAHNAAWRNRLASLLAGYIEAGEAVEAAVQREVWEESGIHVGQVELLTSQAWPYPRSLMIGCVASAESTEFALGDGELDAAYWVSRNEVDSYLASGEFVLPAPMTIASHLINAWREGRLRRN